MPYLSTKAAALLALTGLYACLFSPAFADSEADRSEADRIARLEKRLSELEARLSDQEQETKEVKTLAASSAAGASQSDGTFSGNPRALDIMANSAWRNLRWTQEEQWTDVRKGISEEKVIELLGYPPRSVDSLKPRVDKVFWYETSIRDRNNAIKGKISFKDGKVTAVKKPNFKAVKQAINAR